MILPKRGLQSMVCSLPYILILRDHTPLNITSSALRSITSLRRDGVLANITHQSNVIPTCGSGPLRQIVRRILIRMKRSAGSRIKTLMASRFGAGVTRSTASQAHKRGPPILRQRRKEPGGISCGGRWRPAGGIGGDQGALTILVTVPLWTLLILFGAGLVALIGHGAECWWQKGPSLT